MNLLFGNCDSKHKLSNFQHKINYIKNCIHKYHIHTLFLIINLLILVYYIITTIYAHQLFAIYFTSVFIMLFSTDGYYRIGFKIYDKFAELKPDQFFKLIYESFKFDALIKDEKADTYYLNVNSVGVSNLTKENTMLVEKEYVCRTKDLFISDKIKNLRHFLPFID